MSDDLDDGVEDEEQRAPICASCGVTALVADSPTAEFVCENPDCEAFGDPV